MGYLHASLVDDLDWVQMSNQQQDSPAYFWYDGRPLSEAPVDFAATFDGAMWMASKPISVRTFNRNPLRVRPHFVVPRHHHNLDEMIFVFAGYYDIQYGDEGAVQRVGPGQFLVSRAGTPYTMSAGPEGVTYIETWPRPVTELETYWHDEGWIHRT